jgi:hypothetical protein
MDKPRGRGKLLARNQVYPRLMVNPTLARFGVTESLASSSVRSNSSAGGGYYDIVGFWGQGTTHL